MKYIILSLSMIFLPITSHAYEIPEPSKPTLCSLTIDYEPSELMKKTSTPEASCKFEKLILSTEQLQGYYSEYRWM